MATKIKKVKQENREVIVNNAPRLFDDFPVGSVSHQGDLIFVSIAALPKSAKTRTNRQLADGNTQGSRHIVEHGKVYDCDSEEVVAAIKAANKCTVDARYIGPVFTPPAKPSKHDVTHPEHGHQGFPTGSVVAVVFQRNLDAEQRERRTVD